MISHCAFLDGRAATGPPVHLFVTVKSMQPWPADTIMWHNLQCSTRTLHLISREWCLVIMKLRFAGLSHGWYVTLTLIGLRLTFLKHRILPMFCSDQILSLLTKATCSSNLLGSKYFYKHISPGQFALPHWKKLGNLSGRLHHKRNEWWSHLVEYGEDDGPDRIV